MPYLCAKYNALSPTLPLTLTLFPSLSIYTIFTLKNKMK